MLTAKRLCSHIIRLLHAPIRVYDTAGEQTAIYVDHGEQQDALACDKEFLHMLLEKGRREAPVLSLEAEDVVYSMVCDKESIYILGPCCIGQDPTLAARQSALRHGMDTQKPYRISCVFLYDFLELTLTLNEQLTGQEMEYSELLLRSFCDQRFESAMKEKVHQVFYAFRESAAIHNPYDQELREQESIRTGNLEALYRSFEETYVGKFGTLSHDPLRNVKNLMIVLTTLACRSAIAGGILPEVAFSMQDAFVLRIEELTNPGEVFALGRQAEVEYCTAVRNLSSGEGHNALLARCKNLITQQLHSRLTVKELARQMKVSPDHLSHLFVQKEGMKLTDYVMREKINYAKQHLAYTQSSCEMLAFSLGFSSQSHFGQVFKKWAGMTPKQYRERYGKQSDG